MKKIFFFTLISLYVFSIPAISKIDSLKINLNNAREKDQARILNDIAQAYYDVDAEKIIEYANLALQLSQKYKLPKQEAKALQHIGTGYFFLSNYSEAQKYLENGLELAKKIKFTDVMIDTLEMIGHICRRQSQYKKALEYYYSALETAQQAKYQDGIIVCYNSIGMAYWTLNQYDEALEYFLKFFIFGFCILIVYNYYKHFHQDLFFRVDKLLLRYLLNIEYVSETVK